MDVRVRLVNIFDTYTYLGELSVGNRQDGCHLLWSLKQNKRGTIKLTNDMPVTDETEFYPSYRPKPTKYRRE